MATACAASLVAGLLAALSLATAAPADAAGTGTLSLYKAIENLNTGSSEGDRSKWDVRAVDVATGQAFQGDGLNGFQTRTIPTGSYRISEVSKANTPAGYRFRDWNCGGTVYTDPTPTISLAEGQNLTCTITNVAVTSTLTLRKVVEGGSASAAMWTLTAQGPSNISGPGNSGQVTNQPVRVNSGPYTLSESGGPAGGGGYTASPWTCTYTDGSGGSGSLPVSGSNQVTIALGQAVTCTITNTATATDAHLTLVKVVRSPGTGNPAVASASDFTLTAAPPTGTPISGATGSNQVSNVLAQPDVDYALSENGPAGYSNSGWSCAASSGTINSTDATHVNLAAGADVTCTITNTFTGGWLTLVKKVENSSQAASSWTLTATGSGIASGTSVSGTTGSSAVTTVPVPTGDYGLSESGPSEGYTSDGYVCTGSDAPVRSVSVGAAANVTCTITNSREPTATQLTLVKQVDNTGGGPFTRTAWGLSAVGPVTIAGRTGISTVTYAFVRPGSYTLGEGPGRADPDGYFARYRSEGWSCTDANSGTLALTGADAAGHPDVVAITEGMQVICTVSNKWTGSEMTFHKQVVNSPFGSHTPSEWTLAVTPAATPDGPEALSGNGQDGISDVPIAPGDYILSETDGPSGYRLAGYQCVGATVTGDRISVPASTDVTCTVTNRAIPPTLTLVKDLDNSGGGTAEVSDFTLKARGPGDAALSGPSGDPAVTDVTTAPGDYVFTEDGPTGYESSWSCVGGTSWNGTVAVLDVGQDMVCTATNTFVRPTLTLVKHVDGGPASANDWRLSADGPGAPVTGVTGDRSITDVSVDAGSYELSEAAVSGSSDATRGYAAGSWSCTDGTLDGSSLTLSGGQDATCTITNTWAGGTLTLVKQVSDGGGTPTPPGTPEDWTLTAAGPVTLSGAGGSGPSFVPSGSYDLSEALTGGPVSGDYHAAEWTCSGNGFTLDTGSPGTGTVQIDPGADVTCTLVNLFAPPHLTLRKVVKGGGPLGRSADWDLSFQGATKDATGVTGDANITGVAVGSGDYTLSEATADPTASTKGYQTGAWECSGGTVRDHGDGTADLALTSSDLDVVCTVTNTWTGSTLTLVKTVDNGGPAPTEPGTSHDWTLTATGDDTTVTGPGDSQSIVRQQVPPGSYALSEVLTAGSTVNADYVNGDWVCTTPAGVSFDPSDSTLRFATGANADVTCTVVNRFLPPHLTLTKIVSGGGPEAAPANWPLSFTNPGTGRSGTGVTGTASVTDAAVGSGTVQLGETPRPGYRSGDWACTGATGTIPVAQAAEGVATVDLTRSDADVHCTITNTWVGSALTLVKVVDDGGPAPSEPGTTHDWTLTATGSGTAAGTIVTGPGDSTALVRRTVPPGDYVLSEAVAEGSTVNPDYVAGDWSCTTPSGTTFDPTDARLTVSAGADADITCTIVNRFLPPHITLKKTVIGGGPYPTSTDWPLRFTNPGTGRSGSGVTGAAAVTDAAAGTGTVTLSETTRADYRAGTWRCTGATEEPDRTADGTATLLLTSADTDVTCTITNTWTGAHLTLVKDVDNGGLEPATPGTASDWTLSAVKDTNDRLDVSGTGNGYVGSGSYGLSEAPNTAVDPGYKAGHWSCTGSPVGSFRFVGGTPGTGTITLDSGADVTCTLSNLFDPPHLTLRKIVDGGPLPSTDDWTLRFQGSAGRPAGLGVTRDPSVTDVAVGEGTYNLSEAPTDAGADTTGYAAGEWTCTGSANTPVQTGSGQARIQLDPADLDVVCTITNDWTGGSLTLTKNVVGGTAAPSDWTLSATPDDGGTRISGTSGQRSVTQAAVLAGSYTLKETANRSGAPLDEYTAGNWNCTGGNLEGEAVTVPRGADVRCEITNTFDPAQLTLIKRVVGGTARPTSWRLSATGPTTISGTSGDADITNAPLQPGRYTLAEAPVDGQATTGYTSEGWRCVGATPIGDTLALHNGDEVTCTITNRHTTSSSTDDGSSASGATAGDSGTGPAAAGLAFTGANLVPLVISGSLALVAGGALLLAQGAHRRLRRIRSREK
ncbi:hypothetical protein [Curtobacterium pusillum]|uniref:SpaA-like prealbumin fold domain-containing protein n=1 Tax=Curtobacterium pusillum TaxID=69373 RepID=A0ABX2M9Y9_9MICO|nr:hypothetical protein [Curtobacterium pusillum]NUU12592.1 hypothetical protein [Curtobacterium pusillum]